MQICFYFQVHQPYRLKNYRVFDIGNNSEYFDDKKNRDILRKVAHKCYLPANAVILELLKKHPEFKVAYSFSGTVLDQFEKYYPEVLHSFQKLAETGQVEILDETYYHSLSFVFSKEEFKEQVKLHRRKIYELFGQKPKVFRNTELIYNNELANYVEKLGYKAIVAEGWDPILQWRSPNYIYKAKTTQNLKLLLKNYRLSDDVAFRFSNKGWVEHPLTVDKYSRWVNAVNGNGYIINLFMDYETFGEHQWEDTGIFEFLRHLPGEVIKNPDNGFVTPSEAIEMFPDFGEVDIHHPISWADMERDLSAWMGNKMQDSALSKIYAVEKAVKETKNKKLISDWRKLTTSDHFYYMCTKWFSDGDVHKYFNPYDSPYDCYIAFMNAFNDIQMRMDKERVVQESLLRGE